MYRTIYVLVFLLGHSVIGEIVDSNVSELSSIISLVIALDSSLVHLLSKPPDFYSIPFTPYSATQLFTQTAYNLQIQNPSDYLIFTYIALNSTEYKLTQFPILSYKYQAPVSLEITFTPLRSGIRTAYLLLETQTGFSIYYFQGISVDTPYKLQKVHLEYFQGNKAIGQIQVFNPLERKSIVFVYGTDEFSFMQNRFEIDSDSIGEIEFESRIENAGEYELNLLLAIEEVKYWVPVRVKVNSLQAEFPRFIDFGILTASDTWFVFDLKCSNYLTKDLEIIKVHSGSDNVKVKVQQKGILKNSKDVKFGTISVKTSTEGAFTGEVRVSTSHGTYIVEYRYKTLLRLLEYTADMLTFPSKFSVKRKISIKSKLEHEIWIDKVRPSHSCIELLTPLLVLNPNDPTEILISVNSSVVSEPHLTLISNIGNLILPLHITEPNIVFFSYKNKKPIEIYGPLDLGFFGHGVPITAKIGVKNPNDFEIQIFSIQDLSSASLKYTGKLFISAFGQFEFTISIKPEHSIFEPITFTTSIGVFSLSVYITVLAGNCKVKPIYITELLPKVPREEFIYLVNNYPVPVKILSVSTSLDFVASSKAKEIAIPGKDQVIGKVLAMYTKMEKVKIDFKKSLTYGDARLWNQLAKGFDSGERIGEIKVVTDVAGEIKAGIYVNVKKPHFTIETQSKFSICKVFETCAFNIRVHNPLKVPLTVQLLVAPEYFIADLNKYDCAKQYKYSEFVDDEFEGITPDFSHMPNSECLGKYNDEIDLIKQSNEKKLVKYIKPSKETGLFEKILNALIGEDDSFPDYKHRNRIFFDNQCKNLAEMQEDWLTSQYLFLGEKYLNLIPAEDSKLLGPIIFQPSRTGIHNLSLILRNNYTVIETHSILTNVGFTKLAIMRRQSYTYFNGEYFLSRTSLKKEYSVLLFEITGDDISKFANPNFVSPIVFRTFELQNLGNIDAEISGILLDDYTCEKNGYRLVDCEQSFLLKPQESISIGISFYLSQSKLNEKVSLLIITADEVLSFPFESNVPDELLMNNYLYAVAEEALVLSLAFYLSLFVLLARNNIFTFYIHNKAKSTKDAHDIVTFRYFCKKYSQPIFFSNQETVVQTEPEVLSTPQVIEAEVVQAAKGKKKAKVKRNLTSIIQKAETGKKNGKAVAVLPEIIATNRFLLEKKKKIIEVSKEIEPNETEKVVENDDDFYIDSFKTSNILFGGLSDRESTSLAELTQDSDPID